MFINIVKFQILKCVTYKIFIKYNLSDNELHINRV